MSIKNCNSNSCKYIDRITLNFIFSMLVFLDDNDKLYNKISDLIKEIVIEEEKTNIIITKVKLPIKLYNEIISYNDYLQNLLLTIGQ